MRDPSSLPSRLRASCSAHAVDLVFLPESITSVRAALQGEIQRVINLCHGALVSTVGLTIPVVLIIGRVTGQTVVLFAVYGIAVFS